MQTIRKKISPVLALLILSGTPLFGSDEITATNGEWQQAYKVRSRLIIGGSKNADAATRLAFVQLELEPGWKTYWRHPGESGGIPPEFAWQGSSNLKLAHVLYPAPHRMVEDLGDTIGYKKSVIFPLRLTPKDVGKPIDLHVDLKFGICKDICVPSQAKFVVTVPTHANQSLPLNFMAALDSVPRDITNMKPNDPMLQSVNAPKKDGDMWRIGLTTKHRSKTSKADLFLEAPAGLFIPVPKRSTEGKDPSRMGYEITLSDDEYQALKGKTLLATVVDVFGASQSEFILR